MDIEIREITAEELDTWQLVMVRVFGEDAKDDDLAVFGERMELDRSTGAFDDGAVVATAALWSYEMEVPGGSALPIGGVTGVAVLPTHRRRMILTRMMERQLNQIAGRALGGSVGIRERHLRSFRVRRRDRGVGPGDRAHALDIAVGGTGVGDGADDR